MTIALRLPDGSVLLPLSLGRDETVQESSCVHAGLGYVRLFDGVEEVTVHGPDKAHPNRKLSHYSLTVAVPELPPVADEADMAKLREQWENVDDMYTKVFEDKTTFTSGDRVVRLADVRVIDVSTADIPANASGWTPDQPGIPAPFNAMVPGSLGGIADKVLEVVRARTGERGRSYSTRIGSGEVAVEFSVRAPYLTERKVWVKKDPLNTRRNAKKVLTDDTKLVTFVTTVPVSVSAPTLAEANTEVNRIIDEIVERLGDPVRVCDTCSGEGVVLAEGFRPFRR